MRRLCWLFLLPIVLAARPAGANCEIGAYLIHTIARYLEPSSPVWVVRYEIAGPELRLTEVATLKNDILPELLENFGRTKIEYRGRLCTPGARGGSARVVEAKVEDDYNPEIRLVTPHCFAPSRLPRTGYASYDRKERRLRLASPLPVDRMPRDVPDRTGTESWIEEHVFEHDLKIEEHGEMRIFRQDVESTSFGHTLVGRGEDPFLMTVAILRLRNLDRLYGDPSLCREGTLKGKLADFPVIFFRRPGGTPLYVGDGSWCSSYRLPSPIPDNTQYIGPLERFMVTGAWDLEEDGLPDLLIVNEYFVYYLNGDKLWVADYLEGC